MRVKARIVQERARARQPGRDEHVARRLRPAAGGGAPHQLARARRQPVARLHALTLQVALGVHDRLGLAGRAAGERDQARVVEPQLDGGRRRSREQRLVGHVGELAGGRRRLELLAVTLVGEDQRGIGRLDAQAQVLGPQLLGARQHHGADAKARDHAQHPLGAVADQRHHHVAAADPASRQPPRQARGALGHLAEAPLAPGAVARELHQRQPLWRGRVDDLAREVHVGHCRGPADARPPSRRAAERRYSAWTDPDTTPGALIRWP